jgi:hypothetical protein
LVCVVCVFVCVCLCVWCVFVYVWCVCVCVSVQTCGLSPPGGQRNKKNGRECNDVWNVQSLHSNVIMVPPPSARCCTKHRYRPVVSAHCYILYRKWVHFDSPSHEKAERKFYVNFGEKRDNSPTADFFVVCLSVCLSVCLHAAGLEPVDQPFWNWVWRVSIGLLQQL